MKFLSIVFIFITSLALAQENHFTEEQRKVLNSFYIPDTTINSESEKIKTDLNKILKFDKKESNNRTWAIITTTLASTGLITGLLISEHSKSNLERRSGNAIALGSAIIYGAPAIPLIIGAKKRKRERDALIALYKEKPQESEKIEKIQTEKIPNQ